MSDKYCWVTFEWYLQKITNDKNKQETPFKFSNWNILIPRENKFSGGFEAKYVLFML